MNKINNGGSAFPMIRDMRHNPDWDYHEGMTLRDYFAAKAMQALLGRGYEVDMRGFEGWMEEFGREAYRFADAMLAARQK